MKKGPKFISWLFAFIFVISLINIAGEAQETSPKPTETPLPSPTSTPIPTVTPEVSPSSALSTGIVQIMTNHYRLFYEGSEEEAKLFGQKLEAGLELYNSVLHFDLNKLAIKLKVRIFATKESFNNYLKNVIKETKDDFVYIHYTDLGKCEMVGFLKSNESDLHAALLHQGLVQFLKAYVATPPLWLQEGLAAFFEQAQWSASTRSFSLPTELVWLTTLKRLVKGGTEGNLIPFDTFLVLDKFSAQGQLTVFYPQAWGLVYFLLNSSERNINRILWDSIAALDPSATLMENSTRVKEKAFGWYGLSKLENAFKDYYTNLKSLSELVAEAINLYSINELDKAQALFLQVKERSKDSYIPYYYLGLISYGKKNYADAESYYLKARSLNAPKALISYAMGVNAYADNNFDKAVLYLNEAKKEDPTKYAEKVNQVLESIQAETNSKS